MSRLFCFVSIAIYIFVVYNTSMKVILASASPRRKQLLGMLIKDFEILPSNADENINCATPEETVRQLSYIKAKSVFEQNQDSLVLGADTIVVFDDKILGKPQDEEDARQMLRLLSAKTHKVVTGVSLLSAKKCVTFAETSYVAFRQLSDKDIDDYIKTGSPMDKAGAYGIQDSGFVCDIEGSFDNVVGLPTARLAKVLKQFGGING